MRLVGFGVQWAITERGADPPTVAAPGVVVSSEASRDRARSLHRAIWLAVVQLSTPVATSHAASELYFHRGLGLLTERLRGRLGVGCHPDSEPKRKKHKKEKKEKKEKKVRSIECLGGRCGAPTANPNLPGSGAVLLHGALCRVRQCCFCLCFVLSPASHVPVLPSSC